jgi:TRAP-type mannitol/chloroaromatic compound transport system permease small subunit
LPLAQRIDRLNQWIGRLTLGLVFLMIALGAWNVVGRYLGRAIGQNLTSNALIEGQWYLFDLIFLLGAAYALQQDEHVRVDVFYSNFSPKRKAWANLIGTLFFLIPFCTIAIAVSWQSLVRSWQILETSPDPGGLARYPIKSMIIVSFILLILQGIAEAIKNWAILVGQLPPSSATPESEI